MRRSLPRLAVPVALALTLALAPRASAWHKEGHALITRAAVAALPDRVPAFFRERADTVAGCSSDPDLFRNDATPGLTTAEAPEHFFDFELLSGSEAPPDRYKFLALCAERKIDPRRIGTLPYAVTEATQKLAIAFALHRRRPDDADARARCLLHAGLLSHYAADLCQPLHVTIHFDGRADADGKSPRSGIHTRMDDLLGRLRLTPADAGPVEARRLEKVFPATIQEIERSHALVDRVYELEHDLPTREADWKAAPAMRELGVERFRAASAFTASLFLTAWDESGELRLPEWVDR